MFESRIRLQYAPVAQMVEQQTWSASLSKTAGHPNPVDSGSNPLPITINLWVAGSIPARGRRTFLMPSRGVLCYHQIQEQNKKEAFSYVIHL